MPVRPASSATIAPRSISGAAPSAKSPAVLARLPVAMSTPSAQTSQPAPFLFV